MVGLVQFFLHDGQLIPLSLPTSQSAVRPLLAYHTIREATGMDDSLPFPFRSPKTLLVVQTISSCFHLPTILQSCEHVSSHPPSFL